MQSGVSLDTALETVPPLSFGPSLSLPAVVPILLSFDSTPASFPRRGLLSGGSPAQPDSAVHRGRTALFLPGLAVGSGPHGLWTGQLPPLLPCQPAVLSSGSPGLRGASPVLRAIGDLSPSLCFLLHRWYGPPGDLSSPARNLEFVSYTVSQPCVNAAPRPWPW